MNICYNKLRRRRFSLSPDSIRAFFGTEVTVMDDFGDGLLSIIIGIAIVAALVTLAVFALMALLTVAGIGGLAWGGGTAVVNYCGSIKENIIDENRNRDTAA